MPQTCRQNAKAYELELGELLNAARRLLAFACLSMSSWFQFYLM